MELSERIAREIAAELFTTGSGRKGDHLQIAEGVPPDSVYLAGWCERAVADRVAATIARYLPAAQPERIEHDADYSSPCTACGAKPVQPDTQYMAGWFLVEHSEDCAWAKVFPPRQQWVYPTKRVSAPPALPAARDVWQPIETAPKTEGLSILVFDSDYGVVTVHWRYDERWGGVWGCEDYIQDGSIYDDALIAYKATHWQPLPAPPSAAQPPDAHKMVAHPDDGRDDE